jgi:hypothetical protein
MYSGRKESVIRHINNPNIHLGNATVIPFADSLIARQAGAYGSNPANMGLCDRRHNSFFSNTLEKAIATLERTYRQKLADKIADYAVNFSLARWNQPMPYSNNAPNASLCIDFFTNTEDLFAIEVGLCAECLMIEPRRVHYAKGEDSGGGRSRIVFPCFHIQDYSPESERGRHLRLIAEAGIRPLLKKWLDIMTYTTKDKTIAAIPIPQLSSGNSVCAIRLSLNNLGPNSIMKKYVSIYYLREKCYDLLLSTDIQSNDWRWRVLQNGSTTFTNDDEVMDYLSSTKNSTYGFFRIKLQNPFIYSVRARAECTYLIMLLVGSQVVPTVDSVFDLLKLS